MRPHVLLAVAALLATAAPSSAGVTPEIGVGSCAIETANGTAECYVQLDENPDAIFGQTTWDTDGYGYALLYCYTTDRTFSLGGGYGTDVIRWSHGVELCRLTLHAYTGRSSADVD